MSPRSRAHLIVRISTATARTTPNARSSANRPKSMRVRNHSLGEKWLPQTNLYFDHFPIRAERADSVGMEIEKSRSSLGR
jgi:hypothetical protein